MVSLGNASGPVEPISPMELARCVPLFLTRPVLFNFIDTHESIAAAADKLFDVIESGAVKVSVNQTYALSDAAQAQRELEARKTPASSVLRP